MFLENNMQKKIVLFRSTVFDSFSNLGTFYDIYDVLKSYDSTTVTLLAILFYRTR